MHITSAIISLGTSGQVVKFILPSVLTLFLPRNDQSTQIGNIPSTIKNIRFY
jgi:hypothetical protein